MFSETELIALLSLKFPCRYKSTGRHCMSPQSQSLRPLMELLQAMHQYEITDYNLDFGSALGTFSAGGMEQKLSDKALSHYNNNHRDGWSCTVIQPNRNYLSMLMGTCGVSVAFYSDLDRLLNISHLIYSPYISLNCSSFLLLFSSKSHLCAENISFTLNSENAVDTEILSSMSK